MATYAGGSISTGKLIVNGNITLDPSGGNAASFNAVNISATTVNSTTITTETIIFNSIDVSSNLLVNGNMVVDGSSTFLAPLTANRLLTPGGFAVDTSANVTANTLTGNVTGSITVPNSGSFNCTGLNNYTGNYQIGDLISYNNAITNIGGSTTVTTTVSDAYFTYWYGAFGVSAFYNSSNNAKTNVNVYQIAYWGLDTRTSQPTRLSATVIIPVTQVSLTSTIVSYKHGTLLSYNALTLSNGINASRTATLASSPQLAVPVEYTPWQIANQGYIVVVADNLSYGKSTGIYPYHDPQSEAMSQYAAVVATTQLMTLVPSLFSAPLCTGFTIPATVPVISTGYSLGAQYSGTVSQLIRNSSALGSTTVNTNPNSKPLLVKNTVPGSPPNVYKINETVFEGTTGGFPNISLPTNWLISSLLGEGLAGNPSYANVSGFTQSYIQQVAPVFTYIQDAATSSVIFPVENPSTGEVINPGFIQPLTYASATTYAAARIAGPPDNNYLGGALGYVLPTTVGWQPAAGRYSDTSAGWVIPSAIYDYSGDTSHNFAMDYLKQQTFYTNPFIDYTDLSGSPVNAIYSINDELTCYDPTHWNYGSAGTDNAQTDLSGFVAKITPVGGFAGSVAYAPVDAFAVPTAVTANVTQLITNELGAGPCQTSRWDATGVIPIFGLQHNQFAFTLWSNVICGYVGARPGVGL